MASPTCLLEAWLGGGDFGLTQVIGALSLRTGCDSAVGFTRYAIRLGLVWAID